MRGYLPSRDSYLRAIQSRSSKIMRLQAAELRCTWRLMKPPAEADQHDGGSVKPRRVSRTKHHGHRQWCGRSPSNSMPSVPGPQLLVPLMAFGRHAGRAWGSDAPGPAGPGAAGDERSELGAGSGRPSAALAHLASLESLEGAAVLLTVAATKIQLRETPGNLSGSGSETHQHFSPADANCC
jgi:hypothetical protein